MAALIMMAVRLRPRLRDPAFAPTDCQCDYQSAYTILIINNIIFKSSTTSLSVAERHTLMSSITLMNICNMSPATCHGLFHVCGGLDNHQSKLYHPQVPRLHVPVGGLAEELKESSRAVVLS
eukprot:g9839.t1